MVKDYNINVNYNTQVQGADKTEADLKKINKQLDKSVDAGDANNDINKKNKKSQQDFNREVKKSQVAFKGIRLEFLGIVFGGQAMANAFGSLTDPIKDAIGLQDIWNATLLDSVADGIDPLIDAVDVGGEAFSMLNKALGGNLGTIALVGEAIGGTLSGIGQMVLFADSLAAVFGGMSFKNISGGLGDIFSKPNPNIPGSRSLGDLMRIGIVVPFAFAAAVDAYKDFSEGNILAGIGASLKSTGLITLATARTAKGQKAGTYALIASVGFEVAGAFTSDNFSTSLHNALMSGANTAGLIFLLRGGHPAIGITLMLMPVLHGLGTAIGNATAGDWSNSFIEGSKKIPIWRSILDGLSVMGGGPSIWLPGEPRKFADGGIVTRPTMGLVGEAGPEAIIPLDQAGMMGSVVIQNLNLNTTLTGQNAQLVAREFAQEIRRQTGNRGVGVR